MFKASLYVCCTVLAGAGVTAPASAKSRHHHGHRHAHAHHHPHQQAARGGAPELSAMIERHAQANNVPAALVHRVVRRESNYNPGARNRSYWGLMQIRVDTARSMGYRGDGAGLLSAETNLTYAVPYLANAYRIAGGNMDRAVSLYAGGYYYAAKRRGMLASLRTAADARPGARAATTIADTATPASEPIGALAPSDITDRFQNR